MERGWEQFPRMLRLLAAEVHDSSSQLGPDPGHHDITAGFNAFATIPCFLGPAMSAEIMCDQSWSHCDSLSCTARLAAAAWHNGIPAQSGPQEDETIQRSITVSSRVASLVRLGVQAPTLPAAVKLARSHGPADDTALAHLKLLHSSASHPTGRTGFAALRAMSKALKHSILPQPPALSALRSPPPPKRTTAAPAAPVPTDWAANLQALRSTPPHTPPAASHSASHRAALLSSALERKVAAPPPTPHSGSMLHQISTLASLNQGASLLAQGRRMPSVVLQAPGQPPQPEAGTAAAEHKHGGEPSGHATNTAASHHAARRVVPFSAGSPPLPQPSPAGRSVLSRGLSSASGSSASDEDASFSESEDEEVTVVVQRTGETGNALAGLGALDAVDGTPGISDCRTATVPMVSSDTRPQSALRASFGSALSVSTAVHALPVRPAAQSGRGGSKGVAGGAATSSNALQAHGDQVKSDVNGGDSMENGQRSGTLGSAASQSSSDSGSAFYTAHRNRMSTPQAAAARKAAKNNLLLNRLRMQHAQLRDNTLDLRVRAALPPVRSSGLDSGAEQRSGTPGGLGGGMHDEGDSATGGYPSRVLFGVLTEAGRAAVAKASARAEQNEREQMSGIGQHSSGEASNAPSTSVGLGRNKRPPQRSTGGSVRLSPLSSQASAALLSARSVGSDNAAKWKNVPKHTPLFAPKAKQHQRVLTSSAMGQLSPSKAVVAASGSSDDGHFFGELPPAMLDVGVEQGDTDVSAAANVLPTGTGRLLGAAAVPLVALVSQLRPQAETSFQDDYTGGRPQESDEADGALPRRVSSAGSRALQLSTRRTVSFGGGVLGGTEGGHDSDSVAPPNKASGTTVTFSSSLHDSSSAKGASDSAEDAEHAEFRKLARRLRFGDATAQALSDEEGGQVRTQDSDSSDSEVEAEDFMTPWEASAAGPMENWPPLDWDYKKDWGVFLQRQLVSLEGLSRGHEAKLTLEQRSEQRAMRAFQSTVRKGPLLLRLTGAVSSQSKKGMRKDLEGWSDIASATSRSFSPLSADSPRGARGVHGGSDGFAVHTQWEGGGAQAQAALQDYWVRVRQSLRDGSYQPGNDVLRVETDVDPFSPSIEGGDFDERLQHLAAQDTSIAGHPAQATAGHRLSLQAFTPRQHESGRGEHVAAPGASSDSLASSLQLNLSHSMASKHGATVSLRSLVLPQGLASGRSLQGGPAPHPQLAGSVRDELGVTSGRRRSGRHGSHSARAAEAAAATAWEELLRILPPGVRDWVSSMPGAASAYRKAIATDSTLHGVAAAAAQAQETPMLMAGSHGEDGKPLPRVAALLNKSFRARPVESPRSMLNRSAARGRELVGRMQRETALSVLRNAVDLATFAVGGTRSENRKRRFARRTRQAELKRLMGEYSRRDAADVRAEEGGEGGATGEHARRTASGIMHDYDDEGGAASALDQAVAMTPALLAPSRTSILAHTSHSAASKSAVQSAVGRGAPGDKVTPQHRVGGKRSGTLESRDSVNDSSSGSPQARRSKGGQSGRLSAVETNSTWDGLSGRESTAPASTFQGTTRQSGRGVTGGAAAMLAGMSNVGTSSVMQLHIARQRAEALHEATTRSFAYLDRKAAHEAARRRTVEAAMLASQGRPKVDWRQGGVGQSPYEKRAQQAEPAVSAIEYTPLASLRQATPVEYWSLLVPELVPFVLAKHRGQKLGKRSALLREIVLKVVPSDRALHGRAQVKSRVDAGQQDTGRAASTGRKSTGESVISRLSRPVERPEGDSSAGVDPSVRFHNSLRGGSVRSVDRKHMAGGAWKKLAKQAAAAGAILRENGRRLTPRGAAAAALAADVRQSVTELTESTRAALRRAETAAHQHIPGGNPGELLAPHSVLSAQGATVAQARIVGQARAAAAVETFLGEEISLRMPGSQAAIMAVAKTHPHLRRLASWVGQPGKQHSSFRLAFWGEPGGGSPGTSPPATAVGSSGAPQHHRFKTAHSSWGGDETVPEELEGGGAAGQSPPQVETTGGSGDAQHEITSTSDLMPVRSDTALVRQLHPPQLAAPPSPKGPLTFSGQPAGASLGEQAAALKSIQANSAKRFVSKAAAAAQPRAVKVSEDVFAEQSRAATRHTALMLGQGQRTLYPVLNPYAVYEQQLDEMSGPLYPPADASSSLASGRISGGGGANAAEGGVSSRAQLAEAQQEQHTAGGSSPEISLPVTIDGKGGGAAPPLSAPIAVQAGAPSSPAKEGKGGRRRKSVTMSLPPIEQADIAAAPAVLGSQIGRKATTPGTRRLSFVLPDDSIIEAGTQEPTRGRILTPRGRGAKDRHHATGPAARAPWKAIGLALLSPAQQQEAVKAVASGMAPYIAAVSTLAAVANCAGAASSWAAATTQAFMQAYSALVASPAQAPLHTPSHEDTAEMEPGVSGLGRHMQVAVSPMHAAGVASTPAAGASGGGQVTPPSPDAMLSASQGTAHEPAAPRDLLAGSKDSPSAGHSVSASKRKSRRPKLQPLKRMARDLKRAKRQGSMRQRAAEHVHERTLALCSDLKVATAGLLAPTPLGRDRLRALSADPGSPQ